VTLDVRPTVLWRTHPLKDPQHIHTAFTPLGHAHQLALKLTLTH